MNVATIYSSEIVTESGLTNNAPNRKNGDNQRFEQLMEKLEKRSAEPVRKDSRPKASTKPSNVSEKQKSKQNYNDTKTDSVTPESAPASKASTEKVVQDKVAEAEKEIIQAVSEVLNVPEEVIMQWLASMNLQPLDLTEPQVVSQLLQEAYDVATPVELLKLPEIQSDLRDINALMETYRPLAEAAVQATNLDLLSGLQVTMDEQGNPLVAPQTDTSPVEMTAVVSAPPVETTAVVAESTIVAESTDDPLFTSEDNTPEVISPEIVPETKAAVSAPSSDNNTGAQNNTAQDNGNASLSQPETDADTKIDIEIDTDLQMINLVRMPLDNSPAVLSSRAQSSAPLDPVDVMQQIMSRVKLQAGEQSAEIKMTLRPETLGDVTLKVTTQNGIVTAQFIAENQRVKEVLEANFNQLRDTLQQQGIQVSQLSVSVGQDESEERRNQFLRAQLGTRRRIQRISNLTDSTDEQAQEAPTVSSDNILLDGLDVTV